MKENKLFGTDGIRNSIDSEILSPISITKIAMILASLIKKSNGLPILIGRDTRSSSIYLEHALVAGINSIGINATSVNIVPSAAISFLTKHLGKGMGIMISASHNPYFDNGLKIFDENGNKISIEAENEIEKLYFSNNYPKIDIKTQPGIIEYDNDAVELYIKSLNKNKMFKDMKLVIDCANGAASNIAKKLFSGPNVSFIGNKPDGFNINRNFGSESVENLQKEVLEKKANLGIAFDGDADRATFVDEKGNIIDGDAIIALIAIYLKNKNKLNKNTIVTTIMSSLALDKILQEHGINVLRTDVGDKNVSLVMQKNNLDFGGEQSGHLIFANHSPCADAIYSALQVIKILKELDKPFSSVCNFYDPFPRSVLNISVKEKIPLEEMKNTNIAIKKANSVLKDNGRVLFRYSGTEMKARLLVEALDKNLCQNIIEEIKSEFFKDSLIH